MHTIRAEIESTLRELGHDPNKHLGQNFLIDERVYEQLIRTIEPRTPDTIVEVGPGLGTLTELLAQTHASIIAVEKDHELAQYLKEKFSKHRNVQIMEGDIRELMAYDLKLKANTYKLVGNIPYYLTSHLMRLALTNWPQPERIVFMVQKEIAEKMTAHPPDMSLLSVMIQLTSTPEKIANVSHASFMPQPEVESVIIRLTPTGKPMNFDRIMQIASIAFHGKRKQLQTTLQSVPNMTKASVIAYLEQAGIDPKRRPETLSIEEWKNLEKLMHTA